MSALGLAHLCAAVRLRRANHLCPAVTKAEWTEAEDQVRLA